MTGQRVLRTNADVLQALSLSSDIRLSSNKVFALENNAAGTNAETALLPIIDCLNPTLTLDPSFPIDPDFLTCIQEQVIGDCSCEYPCQVYSLKWDCDEGCCVFKIELTTENGCFLACAYIDRPTAAYWDAVQVGRENVCASTQLDLVPGMSNINLCDEGHINIKICRAPGVVINYKAWYQCPPEHWWDPMPPAKFITGTL